MRCAGLPNKKTTMLDNGVDIAINLSIEPARGG